MNAHSQAASIRTAALAAAIVLALAAYGCGGSNPTSPPPPLPPLSSVVLTPSADTLAVGEYFTFTATARDTLGVVVANATFTWTSTNTAAFTVNGSGQVHGRAEGGGLLIAAAGGKSDTSTVTVIQQRGWYSQVSNLSTDLNAVFFAADGQNGWAVGNGGRIVATTNAGQTWTSQVSNTGFNLNAVFFTSASEGWAAGTGGIMLHTLNGGQTWGQVTSNASEALNDLYFATRDTGWAVGANGLILRTFDRGQSWQRQTPSPYILHSVAFAGTLDGWAVGDNGTILGTHDRGLSWYPVQPSITAQSLRAVWRRSSTLAWASGIAGVTGRTVSLPDTTWTLGNAGSLNTLDGLYYPSDVIGFAVGYNSGGVGVVLRTDDGGQTWAAQSVNIQYRLKDVFFTDPLTGWAVGRNGTIIHTSTGGIP